jgi:hypothetical protein
MGWVGLTLLSATLLPVALAVWIEALTASPIVRCLLLLGAPMAVWWVIHRHFPVNDANWWGYGQPISGGALKDAYDSWDGLLASRFVVVGLLLLLVPLLYGVLRPWARWLLLALPVLALGAYLLRHALPIDVCHRLHPVGNFVRTSSLRQPAAYAFAHLSPPFNVRLLLGSYPSRILLIPPDKRRLAVYLGLKSGAPSAAVADSTPDTAADSAAPEPDDGQGAPEEATGIPYGAPPADGPLAALRWWWAFPSLPMWFGASLYPVLLSLWAVMGLLLGQSLRGRRAEGDVG